MNKKAKTLLIILGVVVVIGLAIAFVFTNGGAKSNLEPITSSEDLTALVDKIYEGLEIEMPMLMSQTVDVTDIDTVKYMTGLEDTKNVDSSVFGQ